MNRSRSTSFLLFSLIAGVTLLSAQTGTKPPASGASSTPSVAQSGTAPASSASSAAATGTTDANVPPDATVITIQGVCDVTPNATIKSDSPNSGVNDPNCKTQVTRAQFEALMKTVAPGAPVAARRQIASRYVQFLTAANEGVKLGVDKDPEFDQQLQIMKLQVLAQDAERKLQAQAANVSDPEVRAYYDKNPSAFEEVTLTRVFVPRGSSDATQGVQNPDSKGIADSARQQLAAGGDPQKVQKSVYDQLRSTSEPPDPKFGAKRHGQLPPAQEQKIFALKPSETSEVFSDSIGYVIYRVESKQQVPFDQAKDEVKKRITQQRLEDARQQLAGASKAEYNDSYFGADTGPRVGALGSPTPGRGTPPSAAPSQASSPAPAKTPK